MAKKTGRPTKLTPEVTERFLTAIKLGATLELACNYAGMAYQTLCNWRLRQEKPYREFFEAVTRAEGQAAIQWLALLEKHSQADARWAAWKLERRYPEDFGRREKVTVELTKTEAAREACQAIVNETGLSEEKAREIVVSRFGVSEQELVSDKVM